MVEVARVDAHLEVAGLFMHRDARHGNLHGLAELVQKILQPVSQHEPRRLGGFAARQLQDVIDDSAYALGVVADDVGEAAFVGAHDRAFREQLTGMTHGAHGVADFMRDAGGQAAESGQFALLHALGHEAGVLEEDQGRTGLETAQGREMGLYQAGAVGGHETRRRPLVAIAAPPGAQRIEQARRDLADQSARHGLLVTQNLSRGFIDETNLVGRVHDQQAFPQMLHDVLRQLREVGEIEVLLTHESVALLHAGGNEARCRRNGEEHHAE